jgi:hypothetical protein
MRMPQGEYVGPASVKVTLVPARAAYLIRAGSRTGFRRAVQEASTRWGGMTEPIIPVRRNGCVDGWWRQVLEISDVEGLVDVDLGPDLAGSVAEALELPVVPIKHIDRDGYTKWTTHPASLPSRGDPTQAPVISCVNSPLWQAVAAGDFSTAHEAQHEGLIRFRRPNTADQVARAALHGQTFLDRTVDSFYEHYARDLWPMPAVVWVTAKDSILDCLWFWNFRALRSLNFESSLMILVPLDDVQHWLNFSRDLAGQLSRPDEFTPDVAVNSATVSVEKLHLFASAVLGLEYSEQPARTGHKHPTTLRVPPFTYRLNLELGRWLTFYREYGDEVEAEAHPVGGHVILKVSSPIAFSNGEYTLLRMKSNLFDGLPKRNVLAEKIVKNGLWRQGAVQISTNATSNYRLDFTIPSLDEAVHTLISSRTMRHELSDKGRPAAALMADSDLSALLRPSVYEAIVHLTTPRAKAFMREMDSLRAGGMPEEEVQAFGARWGGRGERCYGSAAGLIGRLGRRAAGPVEALETLCELGWAERGLETNCDRCGFRSFVQITTASMGAVCPGCRAGTSFTIGESGLAVQYRLNTFIDRASDQGIVPHLLVVAALKRQCEQTSLLAGTLVTLGDGTTPEVDVIGIHDRQFVAGEVKAKARDFTQTQLERDIALSASLGVDTHILATVDDVPLTVVEAAQELANDAKVRLLVLSRDQLRPASREVM